MGEKSLKTTLVLAAPESRKNRWPPVTAPSTYPSLLADLRAAARISWAPENRMLKKLGKMKIHGEWLLAMVSISKINLIL